MADNIKTQNRHTGFELLRIVAMFMIVVMHAIGHGGLGYSVSSNTLNYHIYWFIYALSRVSTNCFVMLTGYYMVKSKIRFSRVFKIWCEVMFYSVLTYFIALKFGAVSFSSNEVIRVLTPVTSGEYWFASAYVLLYLCIPLLNRVIDGIKTKSEFRKILFAMILLTSVLPTICYWADPLFVNGGYGYIWFIVLYFVAAYIRIYDIKLSSKTFFAIYFCLALTASPLRMISEAVQQKIGSTTFVDNTLDYKMPIIFIMSVAFFMLFKNMKIKNKIATKIITAIAPFSFGVYLLHDSDYLRKFLWEIIDVTRFNGILSSLLYVLVISVLIVVISYAVNFIYKKLYVLLGGKKAEKALDKFMKTEKKVL